MAKSSGPLIIGLGAAALLLMGGKKKKSTSGNGNGNGGNGDNGDNGGTGDNGNGGGGGGGTGGGGSGGGSGGSGGSGSGSRASSAGGIWVSSDCKTLEYVNDSPEYWWNKRGKSAAQNFVDANYHDPYEIARDIVISFVPCVAEFPVMEDGLEHMDEEYGREQFLRNFTDAYYLLQWLYNAISELLEVEGYTVEFDDNCELTFVGENWIKGNAERMMRFYINYSYPEAAETDPDKIPWLGADASGLGETFMTWSDNLATAALNRMNPDCALALREAFVKDPHEAKAFFANRPGLKSAYDQLIDLANFIEDNRLSPWSFEPMS